jgi:hypothetical protein
MPWESALWLLVLVCALLVMVTASLGGSLGGVPLVGLRRFGTEMVFLILGVRRIARRYQFGSS